MVTTTLPFAGAEVGPVIHTILRTQSIRPLGSDVGPWPTSSVCMSVPLWQIRIFGLFFFHAKSGYPAFIRIFVQVRIDPYKFILFSNCKWHRRCRPVDGNKNAAMSKRLGLRDGVMCFRLQIHSRWMMKTHWRSESQRSHSGGPTPRTKHSLLTRVTIHSLDVWLLLLL